MSNICYRNGNIYRIYMKNFLTYDEIEVIPKPHLNVVIGPNGTGKSSILCGICIGLGGKPELTGRGKHITEYIKHGKDHSVIEIELFNKEGKDNIVIRREFTRDEKGKSRWYLHNKLVKEKEITAVVASMDIQMNNLCQFLPQDRVVEFAKMNKIELLSSTEKAVGEMKLYEQHVILSQNGKTLQDMNAKLTEFRNQLANEVKKNDQLKDQVRNIKLKEELDKSIKESRLCLLFYNYNKKRKEHRELSTPILELEEQCTRIRARMKPNEDKVRRLKLKLNEHLESVKKFNEESKVFNKNLEKLYIEWERKEEIIEIAEEEFRNVVESNRERGREVAGLKNQLQVLLGQMNELQDVDETAVAEEIKSLTDQLGSTSRKLVSIQNQFSSLKIEANAINEGRKRLEKQLSSAQDIRARRLQILQVKNRDAFAATAWLQNNKDQFNGKIHDPMFSLIDFSNISYSKYLENTVSNQDLVAFVCEDKYDMKTFKRHADNNNWSINILHSSPVDPNSYQPTIPFQNIRRHGFEAYLKDVITAPPAILSYLCRSYNIHNIPFGDAADFERVENINLFFIGNERFSKKQSRYDGKSSTNISSTREPMFLCIANDSQDEHKIQNQLNEQNKRMENLQNSLQALRAEEKKVDKELERIRLEKKEKMVQKDQRKQLQLRVTQKEEQIRRQENNEVDLKEAERVMHSKIEGSIQGLLQIAVKQSELESRVTEHAKLSLSKTFLGTELHQMMKTQQKAMETDEANLREKSIQITKCRKEKEECGLMAKQLLDRMINDLGLTSYTQMPDEVKTNFARMLSQKSVEELKDSLAEKEAHRNCIITNDDSVLLEFQRREEKIVQLKAEEDRLAAEMNNEKESVESCQRTWLPRITELIDRINTHFASFMSKLNCAGQILLDTGSDEGDFSQYGLSIRVKFRDTEKLKELTAHQQSGGERSVSTALYLMALQTLTAVPFRCVDEINQGMDPTNERKMFTMLVETTTTSTASQYFLITPKLLPNLPYNKHVNFLNVFNWSSASVNRQLNSSKILSYYKRRSKSRRSSSNLVLSTHESR